MSTILQIFFLAILGTVTGILTFGLWEAVYFYSYVRLIGPFVLFDIGNVPVEKPLIEGFILGAIFGCVHGLVTVLTINYFQIFTFQRSAVTGAIVAGSIILAAYLFLFQTEGLSMINPLDNMFRDRIFALSKLFLNLLIPAAITGLISAKAVVLIRR